MSQQGQCNKPYKEGLAVEVLLSLVFNDSCAADKSLKLVPHVRESPRSSKLYNVTAVELSAPCNNSYHFWHWKWLTPKTSKVVTLFLAQVSFAGSPSRGKCSATYKFFIPCSHPTPTNIQKLVGLLCIAKEILFNK